MEGAVNTHSPYTRYFYPARPSTTESQPERKKKTKRQKAWQCGGKSGREGGTALLARRERFHLFRRRADVSYRSWCRMYFVEWLSEILSKWMVVVVSRGRHRPAFFPSICTELLAPDMAGVNAHPLLSISVLYWQLLELLRYLSIDMALGARVPPLSTSRRWLSQQSQCNLHANTPYSLTLLQRQDGKRCKTQQAIW